MVPRFYPKMLRGALLRPLFGIPVYSISLILPLNTPKGQMMCYKVLQFPQNT